MTQRINDSDTDGGASGAGYGDNGQGAGQGGGTGIRETQDDAAADPADEATKNEPAAHPS